MTLTKLPGGVDGECGIPPLSFQLANDKLDYLFTADGWTLFFLGTASLLFTNGVSRADEANYQEWVDALEANRTKEPRQPPPKEKAHSAFQRLTQRTARNLAGKAAASPLGIARTHLITFFLSSSSDSWALRRSGKRAIRNKLPREITELIAALKAIIMKESKSKQKAGTSSHKLEEEGEEANGSVRPSPPLLGGVTEKVEDNIYRIGVKIYFLFAHKKLRTEDVYGTFVPALFCSSRC